MSQLEFVIRGQVVAANDAQKVLSAQNPKQVTPKRDPEPKHLGFVVYGYPPGRIKAAEDHRSREIAEWKSLSASEYAERIKGGGKEPRPWNLDDWLATSKPDKLATKQTPQGADDFAALARRHGFEFVPVEELIRGKRGG